jgi:hypothetical protein
MTRAKADTPVPGKAGTGQTTPLDKLLNALALGAADAKVRCWASRLCGGEAAEGGLPKAAAEVKTEQFDL